MSTDGEARQVHRRIAKACENCRSRKAKCDGSQPVCLVCAERGETSSCSYRERPRNRPSKRLKANQASPQSNVSGSGDSSRNRQHGTNIHGLTTALGPTDQHGSVVGRQAHTGTLEPGAGACQQALPPVATSDISGGVNATRKHSHLYYGPSSNFAFLQHIHQSFAREDASTSTGSLDRFKYRDRFFAPGQPKRNGVEKGQHCLFLPEVLARQFLDLFMDSLWQIMPYLNKARLVEMLESLYAPSAAASLRNGDTAIILLSLACGATLTEHSTWVDTLTERAMAAVPSLDVVITMRSVQISLLAIHVHISCGRHNMAYIQLGAAARKAFSVGLHQDMGQSTDKSGLQDDEEIRRLTFWSLAFFERWLAFWLGRPSAMDDVFETPMPSTSPVVKALGELSIIIRQASRLMYDDRRASPAKLWQSAQYIRLELQNFQQRMEPVLGFRLNDGSQYSDIHPQQLFMANFFYHTWTMSFRPFLIMSAARSRHSLMNNADTPSDLWWLPEACQVAIDKAREFVTFYCHAVAKSSVIRGLTFTTAFVEGAICLLAYDALRSQAAYESNIAVLQRAVESLKMMTATAMVPSVIRTVEQLLTELKQVHQQNGIPEQDTRRETLAIDLTKQMSSAPISSAQTQMQFPDDAFGGDLFDMSWSYAVPFDLGFEQGLFAPNLGDYFDPNAYQIG